jgi:hypothetical protein
MWIKTVNEDEATGVVAKIYKSPTRFLAEVSKIIKVHSSTLAILCGLIAFYYDLGMF